MAAKMRKQHFGIFVLQKLLIITVTNYAADCFIERSLMLWIAEAIDKMKSVYPSMVAVQ